MLGWEELAGFVFLVCPGAVCACDLRPFWLEDFENIWIDLGLVCASLCHIKTSKILTRVDFMWISRNIPMQTYLKLSYQSSRKKLVILNGPNQSIDHTLNYLFTVQIS